MPTELSGVWPTKREKSGRIVGRQALRVATAHSSDVQMALPVNAPRHYQLSSLIHDKNTYNFDRSGKSQGAGEYG